MTPLDGLSYSRVSINALTLVRHCGPFHFCLNLASGMALSFYDAIIFQQGPPPRWYSLKPQHLAQCRVHSMNSRLVGLGWMRKKTRSNDVHNLCLGAITWLRKLVGFFNRFAMTSIFSYFKQWETGSQSSFSEKVWHFRHRLLTIINGIWLSRLILVLSF